MGRLWHPRLVSFVLVLALVALSTHWALRLASRRSPAEPVVAMPAADASPRTQPLDTEPLARAFGGFPTPHNGAIKLLGVIAAGTPARDVALVSVDGELPITLGVDDTLPDGSIIVEVRSTGIVLRRGEAIEEIVLAAPPSEGIERAP